MNSNYIIKPTNRMKDIANLLGLELGEEFQITGMFEWEKYKFHITEDTGLETGECGHWSKHRWDDQLFRELLLGYREIVKLSK